MKKVFSYILVLFLLLLAVCSCIEHKHDSSHPWGDDLSADSASRQAGVISYEDIISNGEIIVATMSGPDTYYDYRGISLGTQYLLMKRFTEYIGLRIRIELCKDTAEVLGKLKTGEVDVSLLKMPVVGSGSDFICCASGKGTAGWYVNALNESLAVAVNEWYKPEMVAEVIKEENLILSSEVVIHHDFSYYLNRNAGVICRYDSLFKAYSTEAGVDWRLLASICYQESHFDPDAKSFAGACGLMQLMPSTAESMGLSRDEIFHPEKNISVSARYIGRLRSTFKDIADTEENLKFTLAGYNGGAGHIRDAMALAKTDGKNPHLWNNVAPYVLALSDPSVYNRPAVKYGYMRGRETVNYVGSVFSRWYDYRGTIGDTGILSVGDLSIDDIINSHPQTVPAPAATEAPAAPHDNLQGTVRVGGHRESSDKSIPVAATTKRKSKYDIE